jgi:hypothetical protein
MRSIARAGASLRLPAPSVCCDGTWSLEEPLTLGVARPTLPNCKLAAPGAMHVGYRVCKRLLSSDHKFRKESGLMHGQIQAREGFSLVHSLATGSHQQPKHGQNVPLSLALSGVAGQACCVVLEKLA